ncbi:WD40-repeat-containing domain protein [Lobosporangium transversale]|uniref:WD40-repeat-containing domain protein n=1 Tax=Lobosporangium transversale TaxID=64571 RepID=A0A1Y2GH49_9FUNG|nr:WD40-repeat-containing domain protein [Lobosporangium transversale]ORZ07307.1 WD40-repeat-containing domain protein [Lobosporangium transversale]|eukprot:XP_021877970.1 WD40-repeat-containing domain protein [Lobosporangium transversale]
MNYDSLLDSSEWLAPSLCLNADANEDLAPVQPTKDNLLPASFPTLTWSKQSSDMNNAEKAEKRLCYRHRPDLRSKRAADEIQLEALQQDIGRLPQQDQQIISHIWSLFGSAPAGHRQLVLSGLLTQCCVPQLSFLSNHLQPLLRIDFLTILPTEITLRILSYLDAKSLCHAAQVCKAWRRLADDDVVWHRMCEQHIGLKCTKCGWGLPLLEKKKVRSRRQSEQQRQQQQFQASQDSQDESDLEIHPYVAHSLPYQPASTTASLPSPPASLSPTEERVSYSWPGRRRRASSDFENRGRLLKRARNDLRPLSPDSDDISSCPTPLFQSPEPPAKPSGATKRPWKEIYSERLIVERNWRKRNCKVREFRGHTDGVMCLQFDDTFLITGSYDNTAKVWNIETGECLRTLKGHALCVRALRFDEAKLITGSMDRTLKIWNYHTGQCIRTLQGHTDGVVTLDFDSRILASGSVDSTIKIWNFATGECSTLKGHTDLVNKVQIYKKTMLFSCSDDTTVKLWDIASRACIRTFTGHVGRVQSLQTSRDALISVLANRRHVRSTSGALSPKLLESGRQSPSYDGTSSDGEMRTMMPIVVTGGLDNTLKVWNAETGECLNTLFGHEEGVWSLAFDKLRVVSGSLDKTIKVWDTESGECLYTLPEPEGPVTCVDLGDTRIVGGSANGNVLMWDYGVRL